MRILVVEDDGALSSQIDEALSLAGFTVDLASNGEDGQHLGETEPYDAVILDLGLPIVDGVSVLRAWRAAGMAMPVLILTARGGWQDRVAGLNAGGDDYLGKPFHMEELVARLRALIRRSSGKADAVLRGAGIELNTVSKSVTKGGRSITLTANEFKILEAIMLRPDQVHRKVDLAEMIYGMFEERDSNTIEVFIGRLRRKLGADVIRTVRGLGYR
ncbi:MAG: response regulator transcription factor, partial [Pseudomonadota bacterium]